MTPAWSQALCRVLGYRGAGWPLALEVLRVSMGDTVSQLLPLIVLWAGDPGSQILHD